MSLLTDLHKSFRKRSTAFRQAWQRAGVREHNLGANEVMLGTAHWDDTNTPGLIIMPIKTRAGQPLTEGSRYEPRSGDTILQFRNRWALANFINMLQRLENEHIAKEKARAPAHPPPAEGEQ